MDKILICGAKGMVGKNLVEHAPSKYTILTPGIEELNLLNYNECFEYISSHKPDLIIHAAGIVGGIQANIAYPVKFLLENTDMGRNLVWASYNAGIKKVLNLGSSCMYPRNTENPITEDKILTGELEPTNEGYALSKIFTQRLCAYINKENQDFSFKTVIPCNLYGKYDKFEEDKSHMIPAVIAKIYKAKADNENTVEIWGDGTARREFMFAEDFANILWQFVENFDNMPDLMNVGLGYDYTITEYYKTIAKVIGYDKEFFYNLSKPVGMQQKLVCISKQAQMSLKAEHSLEEGIRKTFNYYLNSLNNNK